RSQQSRQQHQDDANASPPLHDFDAEHDPEVSRRASRLDRRRAASAASAVIEMPEDHVGKSGKKAAASSVIEMPAEYVGKSSIQTLGNFVSKVERDVTATTQGIDQVSSPDALIAGV